MDLAAAAVNAWDATHGGVADLRRMPRDVVTDSGAVLYRYRPVPGAPDVGGPPVLLVPPLGAPDFAYDLRRGCSLVEHLLGEGHTVFLVDYGPIHFADRALGMEHWVDEVVPWAIRETGQPHVVAWSLGGIFALLAVAAAADAGERLPVVSLTVIGSPIDISAVPLVAPLRPLAAATGGRGLSTLYQLIGSFPAPLVSAAFQLLALGGRSIPLSAVDVPVLVVAGRNDVIAPLESVRRVVGLLTGAPEVRFETAPGGHLGVLTGRRARATTWFHLDTFLTA